MFSKIKDKINLLNQKKILFSVCFLVLFLIIGLVIILILHPFIFGKAFTFYLTYYFDTHFLAIIFSLAYIYIFLRFFLIFYQAFIKEKAITGEFKKMLFDIFYFFIIINFGVIISSIILDKLPNTVSTEKIIWTSNMLANLDYHIFGRDLLFSANNLVNLTGGKILSWILLQFYNSFPFVVIGLPLFLFLHNKVLAKKFILFSFLFVFSGFFIWYLLPGLNPLNFYLGNALEISVPERISLELKYYKPNSVLLPYQENFKHSYSPKEFLDVTTFPSVHAGFSVAVIIYAFLLWPPSTFFTLPWFIVEMAGAIYLGQHYAIDLLFGLIIAVLMWSITEIIFKRKKILHG